jgi:methenyltetrahydromethanopterin cyclohydrolase
VTQFELPAEIKAPGDLNAAALNARALTLVEKLVADAARLEVAVERRPAGGADEGATVVDLGVSVPGGIEAGRRLAEICLAGYADVAIEPGDPQLGPWRNVVVRTGAPVAACLASQYAGWKLAAGKFFAMGSGPMRASAAKETVFEHLRLAGGPPATAAVGVLETRKLPPPEIIAQVAEACRAPASAVCLLVAPTASQAGTLQVVARSAETALHKLHELGFDLGRIVWAHGTAPLAPVAGDDMAAIGRTNDAVLYGGVVTLGVRGDDASLEAIGPRVPANASSDYGLPFAEIFARYNGDFYKIDPLLFSPAVVVFRNLDTGNSFRYGAVNPTVLQRSFTA